MNAAIKSHVRRKHSCHELFGFDILLDEHLKPWLVEVNISPSLNSSSPLDVAVKGAMVADLLRLAGFTLPEPREMARAEGKRAAARTLPRCLHFDKRLLPQQLAADERTKHQYYIQRHADEVGLRYCKLYQVSCQVESVNSEN